MVEAVQWTGHNKKEMEDFDARLVYDEARQVFRVPVWGFYQDVPIDWWVVRDLASLLRAVDPVNFTNNFVIVAGPPA